MASDAFYSTVGTVSFVLPGLWWVVVQGRPSWRQDAARRRMTYAVSLHFLLPGAMSILALAAPEIPLVWRISFTLAGILGVVAALTIAATLRAEYDSPLMVRVFQWLVAPLYVLITILALMPELVGRLGWGTTPRQVESLILSIIVFIGVQSAWVLTVEPLQGERQDGGPRHG